MTCCGMGRPLVTLERYSAISSRDVGGAVGEKEYGAVAHSLMIPGTCLRHFSPRNSARGLESREGFLSVVPAETSAGTTSAYRGSATSSMSMWRVVPGTSSAPMVTGLPERNRRDAFVDSLADNGVLEHPAMFCVSETLDCSTFGFELDAFAVGKWE